MTFIQIEFVLFFLVVFTAYWAVRERRLQNVLLIVASALFYGWVHPWFLLLLYVSAAVDYFGGLGIERYPKHKGLVLAASLGANLSLLGYYKYWDFFLTNVAAALDAVGVQNSVGPLGILLPAGISFYTFQSMAYSIDIYRGELKPRKNLLEYMLAVSFFCHLVAGPVQRASNLLMQAETPRTLDWERVRSGFALAMWGAFKKMVCADTVAPYVDKIFALESPSGPMVWAATLGFTIQILADFSGYTDIARGTARMLGWELMENFRHPYLATSPSEFWKRWHISFSTWIRDYLYISFGGSRGGFLRATMATSAAMLISGLWHGASWNFVLWGAYHALLLIGYRLVTPRIPASIRATPAGHVGAVGLMFGFTVFGWLLFRETDVSRIFRLLQLNPLAATADEWVATVVMLTMVVATATPLVLALLAERFVLPRLSTSGWYLPVQTTVWAGFAVCFYIFVRMDAVDFLYFQF
ncbi:MAG: MBOAT family O-acyltransferase [Pseudomonadota bacterium]|nr:MBOAT family O-acyltransferase [Pseudomonadota bacterium]